MHLMAALTLLGLNLQTQVVFESLLHGPGHEEPCVAEVFWELMYIPTLMNALWRWIFGCAPGFMVGVSIWLFHVTPLPQSMR
ncbi:hypothetical protein KP509_22G010400 [Ceratopteris richardii]|uniref:Uncharacterized protein n=1 Tax=Ceratopteris richardii TaxID=49495 RepID=A0A8T2S4Q1_CERRI|nr:hypothetical protein KP509_22G010400 [Ceratopteris richardii]